MVDKAFWTHIKRTSNADILEALGSLDGESEVAKFVVPVLHKDIGKLDISMHNT
jgi:hypothetical protein